MIRTVGARLPPESVSSRDPALDAHWATKSVGRFSSDVALAIVRQETKLGKGIIALVIWCIRLGSVDQRGPGAGVRWHHERCQPSAARLLQTVLRHGEGERMVDLPPRKGEPEVDPPPQRSMKKGRKGGLAGGEVVASKRARKANENVAGIDTRIKTHLVDRRISLAPLRQNNHAPLHIFHLPS